MIENGQLFIETMWIKMELGDEHWPEDLKLVCAQGDGLKWCTEESYENWITDEQAHKIAKQTAIDLIIQAGGSVLVSNDGYSINLKKTTHTALAPAAGHARNIIALKELKEDQQPTEEPAESPLEAAQRILGINDIQGRTRK